MVGATDTTYRVILLFVFVVAGQNPALHRPREEIHHGSVHLQHPLHLQTYFEMGSVLKGWPQICDPSPLPSGVFWDYRCDSFIPTSWVEIILVHLVRYSKTKYIPE